MGNFRIRAFVKRGKKEHIESLLNEGIIYMNSLSYYRNLELQDEVRDMDEGLSIIMNNPTVVIHDPETFKPMISHEANTVKGRLGTINEGLAYCMTAVHDRDLYEDEYGNKILSQYQERLSNFGDSIIYIHDNVEFIKRVKKEAEKKGYSFHCKPVTYYENGQDFYNLNAFCKNSKFSHQQEVRFWIPSDRENLTLKIGSITDIARLHSTDITVVYTPDKKVVFF